MNPREHRIGVVGAGTMGNGIAHVFARSGFEVTLFEVAQAALDRGVATIRTNLDREAAITRQGLTAARSALARQIHVDPGTDLQTLPELPIGEAVSFSIIRSVLSNRTLHLM